MGHSHQFITQSVFCNAENTAQVVVPVVDGVDVPYFFCAQTSFPDFFNPKLTGVE